MNAIRRLRNNCLNPVHQILMDMATPAEIKKLETRNSKLETLFSPLDRNDTRPLTWINLFDQIDRQSTWRVVTRDQFVLEDLDDLRFAHDHRAHRFAVARADDAVDPAGDIAE